MTLIIASCGRGQMLQASGLEPPRHDSISSVVSGSRIVKSRRSRGVGVLHLAALRSSLRSQLERSVTNNSSIIQTKPKQNQKHQTEIKNISDFQSNDYQMEHATIG